MPLVLVELDVEEMQGWSGCGILIKSHLPKPFSAQRHKSAKIVPHCANHSTSIYEWKFFWRNFCWQPSQWVVGMQFSSLSEPLFHHNTEDEQVLVILFFYTPVVCSKKLLSWEVGLARGSHFASVLCCFGCFVINWCIFFSCQMLWKCDCPTRCQGVCKLGNPELLGWQSFKLCVCL